MKQQSDYPLILTVKDVAEIMQCSQYAARNLMTLKGFPVVRCGYDSRIRRVGRDSFFKWLEWHLEQQMKQYEFTAPW
jgi:hypothetical protein